MAEANKSNTLLIVVLLVVVAIVGYNLMTAPDTRSTGDKIGDAVNELPNGVDKAARQLEDRTPAEKLGDSVEDAGDDVKKTFNQE